MPAIRASAYVRPLSETPVLAIGVAETCRSLGLCHRSVYRLINSGRLKSVLVGRRRLVLTSSRDELLGIPQP